MARQHLNADVGHGQKVVEHIGLEGEAEGLAILRQQHFVLILGHNHRGIGHRGHLGLVIGQRNAVRPDVVGLHLLPYRHDDDAGVADVAKEMLVHIVPCAAAPEVHQAFLAAIDERALAVKDPFGHVAQHVHDLVLVGHLGGLDHQGKALPGDDLVRAPDDAVGQCHTSADVVLQGQTAVLRQTLVSGPAAFGRGRTAESHLDQFDTAVALHTVQKRHHAAQPFGIVGKGGVQPCHADGEADTHFPAAALPERLQASEEHKYFYQ